MKTKTKEEIIIETIRHYTVDGNPRSLSKVGYCAYHGEGGAECAFQRVLTEEGKQYTEAHEGERADHLIEEYGMKIIKPAYQTGDQDFWVFVQSIHDCYVSNKSIYTSRAPLGIDWNQVEKGIEGTGIIIKRDDKT